MKRKKKNIFQKIWGMIDKTIIVPITRLILKAVKFFDKFEKSIETWMSK